MVIITDTHRIPQGDVSLECVQSEAFSGRGQKKEEEEEQQQQQQQHEDKEGRGGAFSSCSPRTSRQRRPCSRWP